MCSQSVQPTHSANCFYYLVTPGRHMYLTDGSGSSDFTIPISQLRKPDWPYVGKVSEKHYILRGSPKYLTRSGNYTHAFFLLFLAQALSVQPIINVTITSEGTKYTSKIVY